MKCPRQEAMGRNANAAEPGLVKTVSQPLASSWFEVHEIVQSHTALMVMFFQIPTFSLL